MYHKLYKVIDYQNTGTLYAIWRNLKNKDASEQIINLERPVVLYGEMWGALRDLTFFNQVTIDPIARTLCWPNGADFDAETLRNWPDYKDELANRAQSWEKVLV